MPRTARDCAGWIFTQRRGGSGGAESFLFPCAVSCPGRFHEASEGWTGHGPVPTVETARSRCFKNQEISVRTLRLCASALNSSEHGRGHWSRAQTTLRVSASSAPPRETAPGMVWDGVRRALVDLKRAAERSGASSPSEPSAVSSGNSSPHFGHLDAIDRLDAIDKVGWPDDPTVSQTRFRRFRRFCRLRRSVCPTPHPAK